MRVLLWMKSRCFWSLWVQGCNGNACSSLSTQVNNWRKLSFFLNVQGTFGKHYIVSLVTRQHLNKCTKWMWCGLQSALWTHSRCIVNNTSLFSRLATQLFPSSADRALSKQYPGFGFGWSGGGFSCFNFVSAHLLFDFNLDWTLQLNR